jgi:hypothetical protein
VAKKNQETKKSAPDTEGAKTIDALKTKATEPKEVTPKKEGNTPSRNKKDEQ